MAEFIPGRQGFWLTPDSDPGKVIAQDSSISGDIEVLPPTRATVTALVDAKQMFDAVYQSISSAKEYVYISIWHIHVGTIVGKQSFKSLIRSAAKRGVQVRILITYLEVRPFVVKVLGIAKVVQVFENAYDSEKIQNLLELQRQQDGILRRYSKNLEIVVYEHPVVFTPPSWLMKLEPAGQTPVLGVSHEKLIIVDGKMAFCGGMEFMTDYYGSSPEHKGKGFRHDVHALISGPAVKHFERHFVRHWRMAMVEPRTATKTPKVKDLPDPKNNYDTSATDQAVQVAITRSIKVASPPFYQTMERGIYDAYLDAIACAKQYIYIENQYFRDKGLAQAVVNQIAVQKDLRVIVVLPFEPEENKSKIRDHAIAVERETLDILKAGGQGRIGVFSLKADRNLYVHSKIMIVDDKWVTIGTANTNPRSFLIDDEINLIVRDDAFAKSLRLRLWEEHFQPDDKLKKKLDGVPTTFLDLWNDGTKTKRAGKHIPRMVVHSPGSGSKLPFPWVDQFVWLDVRTGHDGVVQT